MSPVDDEPPDPIGESPEGEPPPDDSPDSFELARRARGGDGEALNQLFLRYQERVVRIARIRMGSRLRSCMESMDLVQETWRVALRLWPDFEPRSHASLIQWLARILENRIREAARHHFGAVGRDHGREVPLELGSGSEGGAAAIAPSTGSRPPWEVLAREELRELYDACVEELTGDQREVVLLREYSGASWEETARALGRSKTSAVQELHRRARMRIAECLERRLGNRRPDSI